MKKWLLLIVLIIVALAFQFNVIGLLTQPNYEDVEITFQGFEPDTYGDCKTTCELTCPQRGFEYKGFRYNLNKKECVCFCLKEV